MKHILQCTMFFVYYSPSASYGLGLVACSNAELLLKPLFCLDISYCSLDWVSAYPITIGLRSACYGVVGRVSCSLAPVFSAV
jgi:hypothetical protein